MNDTVFSVHIEYKQRGAIGAPESTILNIYAENARQAYQAARAETYKQGHEHVLVKKMTIETHSGDIVTIDPYAYVMGE